MNFVHVGKREKSFFFFFGTIFSVLFSYSLSINFIQIIVFIGSVFSVFFLSWSQFIVVIHWFSCPASVNDKQIKILLTLTWPQTEICTLINYKQTNKKERKIFGFCFLDFQYDDHCRDPNVCHQSTNHTPIIQIIVKYTSHYFIFA